jgi:hypothetical protein
VKEQILHLDPHDDYHSARDKMGWTQTQRVMLVWPRRGPRVLTRRLDLLLLHRHARQLGAHLALITSDAEVREHARDLGLPVFPTLEASRRQPWRTRPARDRRYLEREASRPDVRALRPPTLSLPAAPQWLAWTLKSLIFLLGLGALGALAYTLLPSATVTLEPAIRPVSAQVEIVASPELTGVAADGLIPARMVRVEVGPETDTTPTTGSKSVPKEQATGTVVFTNLVGTAVTIPQGTGVRTTGSSAIRFTTTRAVSIEGRIGASVEALVRAAEPGPTGNVGLGQINAIDGPLGLQLAVTNPAPTSGGALEQSHVVTDADRQRLRDEMLARLIAKAQSQVEAQLRPGEFAVADSITVTQIIIETYEQSVGEVADAVNLTLRIAVTGLAVNENDARVSAQQALDDGLSSGETLLAAQTQFKRDPQTTLDPEGRAHFTVTIDGAAAAHIEGAAVQQALAGQPLSQAQSQLARDLPIAAAPHIVVWPEWYTRWLGRLPWLAFRIQVVVQS